MRTKKRGKPGWTLPPLPPSLDQRIVEITNEAYKLRVHLEKVKNYLSEIQNKRIKAGFKTETQLLRTTLQDVLQRLEHIDTLDCADAIDVEIRVPCRFRLTC